MYCSRQYLSTDLKKIAKPTPTPTKRQQTSRNRPYEF